MRLQRSSRGRSPRRAPVAWVLALLLHGAAGLATGIEETATARPADRTSPTHETPAASESPSEAPEAGALQIDRWTVDGGGGWTTGGNRVVGVTIAQPDAGVASSTQYRLEGGFWTAAGGSAVFRDGFESGDTSLWSQSTGWTLWRPRRSNP